MFLKFKNSILGISLLATLAIGACTSKPYVREEAAKRISAPVWMVNRQIPANEYSITAYERMHKRHSIAHLYIEGDGSTWTAKNPQSVNPTPINPVALHLAAHDLAENVVYLARPCQYSTMVSKTASCPTEAWTNGRFSQGVIDAYKTAMDEIKKRYDITEFHLIGHSGGGAIAAILATQRDDVLSLRTVAAPLNHTAFTHMHAMPPMDKSINPIDLASQLRTVPQHHFIGGQDRLTQPAILHSYLQALGANNCTAYTFIQEAEHEAGWVEKWPELLAKTPLCAGPQLDFSHDPYQPVRIEREAPAKP
ncbi:MAG: hypothetical protein ACK4VI_06235 [Alphaproteobacteria bacterium]